jgi:hypothetical protein
VWPADWAAMCVILWALCDARAPVVPFNRSELSTALSSMEKAVAQDNLPSAQVISSLSFSTVPLDHLTLRRRGWHTSSYFISCSQCFGSLSLAHLPTSACLQAFDLLTQMLVRDGKDTLAVLVWLTALWGYR